MPAIQVITYFAYAFIVIVYTWRTIKFARLPLHLRWDLYPMPSGKHLSYGSSHYEEIDSWKKPQKKYTMQKIIFIIKDYISFFQYYRKNRGYWFILYPWHIGFYLIFLSHVLYFFGGIALLLDIPILAESSSIPVLILYYATLITSIVGCFAGAIGSIGLLIRRITDRDLKNYSTPISYFTYVFFFLVFFSGLYSWYFFDPTFSSLREFWRDLIAIRPVNVDIATGIHIILFALFLIYMPFTRAMHYITKFFAFFGVRWDDSINLQGSDIEAKLIGNFKKRINWSAPHIQSSETWADVVEDVQQTGNDQ